MGLLIEGDKEMYAYIRGKIEFKSAEYLVIEAGGIGYKIFTSAQTLSRLGNAGEEAKIYTHLYVREDIFALYGFYSTEELSMFELLISVSGVGPKAAISLMSAVSPSKFGVAVITDDYKCLTKAQGIGSKTAQRIILELKDKLKKQQFEDVVHKEHLMDDKDSRSIAESNKASEAISALMVLGYTAIEAGKAVASVYSEELDLESIIKSSLKNLAR